MTHCNGCPFSADCNGHCGLDPIVSVVPKALAYMTIWELRKARSVAIEAGCAGRANEADKYIRAYYQACEDFRDLVALNECVEDEICTVCAGCSTLMGECDDMTYYAGQNWCTDCRS